MLPICTFEFVVTAVYAIAFYRAGGYERVPVLACAAISAAVPLAIRPRFARFLPAMIPGQVAPFAAIGVTRVLRDG